MFESFRDRALQEGMKLMQDPRVQKLMQDPRAGRLLMEALQLPGRVESAFAAQGRKLARRFKLATREEVDALKGTIRHLERTIRDLKAEQYDDHGEHGDHGEEE